MAELTKALEESSVAFGLRYNKIKVRAPADQAHRLTTQPAHLVCTGFFANNTVCSRVRAVQQGFKQAGSRVLICPCVLGVQVKDFEAFRRSLPEGSRLFVAKNTLLGLAADRVPGWSDLKRNIKLENAWVFASEDAMADSVKAFLAFEKKLLEPIPKADREKTKLTQITGAAPFLALCSFWKHGRIAVT